MKKFAFIAILVILSLSVCLCSCGITGKIVKNNVIRYENASRYSVGNFTYDSTMIDKVEVHWIFGNINVSNSDNATLSVSEEDENLSANEQLRYLIEGRTLKIQFWKSGYSGRKLSKKKNLNLEIPKHIELEIDQVSGNVNADKLLLSELDIEIVSGDTTITELISQSLDIDNVSGNIDIGNIRVNEISVETVSGNVDFSLLTADSVKIDSVSGNVDVSLLSGLGAVVEFSSVSGKYRKKSDFPLGLCKIEVDTVSGDLTVR